MIFVGIVAAILLCILSFFLGYYLNQHNSDGTLYFHEKDKSMYLELNDVPKNGTITLKIRRV